MSTTTPRTKTTKCAGCGRRLPCTLQTVEAPTAELRDMAALLGVVVEPQWLCLNAQDCTRAMAARITR